MEAVDDDLSVGCCSYSNNNDNFATFLDLTTPLSKKKAAEKDGQCREKPEKRRGRP
jgi:hypothetical protein